MDDQERTVQTTVTLSRESWRMLRALAEARALERGGRPNASAIVAELVERESGKGRHADA